MQQKIEKISIPDEHMLDWMQTLRKGGFTNEEIDSIFSHLNTTYAGIKKKEYVDREIQNMKDEVKKRSGRELTLEEINKIREGIESRWN